jgi:hypothetical protein
MSQKINAMLKGTFFSLGMNVSKHTSIAELTALIKTLRPYDCGKNLIGVGMGRDGGYLIPDDLEGIEYCFSPGVNDTSNFEDAMAERGIKSFMADYSVEGPAIPRPEFTFDKKFLGAIDSEKFITLPTWKNKYIPDHGGDLILQMDIEGFEYQVLLNTPNNLLDQFRIIVIEFHGLEKLFDPYSFEFLSVAFEKLTKYFVVSHIHPNNYAPVYEKDGVQIPSVLEITFLNKKRVAEMKPQTVFPHPLDEDNYKGGPPLILSKSWYTD